VLPLADRLVEKHAFLEGHLFVAIADIELKKGIEQEFKEWFSRSTRLVAKHDGFIARKLLKSAKGGQYRIIIIMESKEAFAKLHATTEHAKLHAEALTFMTRPPIISAYESVS
jgi:heme-degrading monooxygenase HmoA